MCGSVAESGARLSKSEESEGNLGGHSSFVENASSKECPSKTCRGLCLGSGSLSQVKSYCPLKPCVTVGLMTPGDGK